ncbi:MAG: lamin tail domain-containing protein [Balneolaceae bacterium]
MTKCLSFCILLLFSFSTLQAQVVIVDEDFEDQDLTQNTEWTGDTGNFSFFDDNGNTLLRLTAPEAGNTQLRTSSTTAYGSWEFFIDQDFSPSNGNRGFIFLMSDIEDLDGNVNGYAIRSGESSSDDKFRLFRFTDGSSTEILSGDLDISGGGPYQVRVTRDTNGIWSLYESEDYNSIPIFVDDVEDNNHTVSDFFGWQLDYTATRAENFFFDSIRILDGIEAVKIADVNVETGNSLRVVFTEPLEEASLENSNFELNGTQPTDHTIDPVNNNQVVIEFQDGLDEGDNTLSVNDVEDFRGNIIEPNSQLDFSIENPFTSTGTETISNSEIDLFFTEEIDALFVDPANFEIDGEGNPDQVTQPEAGTLRLEFNTPLTSGEYTLSISDIQSINGWSLVGDDTFDLFIFDDFDEGDLIISEFFYRVPVDWRTDEFDRPRYVELFNSSDKFLNLRDFTFNGETISSVDLPISPNEYLVVTRGETVFLEQFGERNFVEAEHFPSLNLTTENEIVVRSDNDVAVDSLFYRSTLWGGNGRSLERKSFGVSPVYSDNWGESEDALFGSPGLSNTVAIPTDPPEVTEITFPVPKELRVEFSRALSAENVQELSNFSLSNSTVLESTAYNTDDRKILIFNVQENLLDQTDYTFTFKNTADIFGNEISGTEEFEFRFLNPFRVLSGDVQENNDVLVQFTQPLNVSTVSASNFQLSDGTNPTSIEFPDSENARLRFPDEFEIGSYSLLINDIESIVGWAIETNTKLDFFVFDEYEPGDIVINEFMYNIPDGYSQYVEFFNTSDKVLNIRDWELRRADGATNNGSVISENSLAIEPNGFLVIADDTTQMANNFGQANWHEMADFPGITQTQDDDIRLFDKEGNMADSLRYVTSEWGGTDVALERRSANVTPQFVENWGESPNELLGTPGFANEIEPDNTPPVWESIFTSNNNAFILRFDERLDEESAILLDNYSIKPSVDISTIKYEGNEVRINLGTELESDTEYEVTISSIADLFVNTIEIESRIIEYLEFEEAKPRQVVINEVLYRRLQAGSPEFIELYNNSEQNVDLSEWTLSNTSGSTPLPEGTSIRKNDYIVFTDTETFAADSDKIVYLSGFQSLSNDGDAVVLKNRDEAVIDSLYYLPTWGNNTQGISLERHDPDAISVDRANWTPSSAENGSTPAAENSRFEPDESSPEIIFANLFHPDSLEVRFSEFINLNPSEPPKSLSGLSPSTSNEETATKFLVNGQESELLVYDPNRGDRIVLDSENVIPGEEVTISIKNFGDFQGNFTSGQEQPIARPVQEGDLVFNEIMYDPIRDNRENLTNQSEYIEIVNRRPYAISVEGMFLHDRPDDNDQITALRPESTVSKWIPANGVLLFHAEDRTDVFAESYASVFFDLDAELESRSLRINRSTLSLTLSGREIYLADSTRTTIDKVDYRPEWHNPNLIDTRGKSLERVSPDGDTNDPVNWSTNTQPIGGTPATENSIFQETPQPLTETGISFDPNPFSPDGDGFDDNLFINYKFDEPDYLMRIRIYDRYGRLVRTLVDAHQAGFEGSIIWDGLSDDGQSNRIGIYIVYVEAYNSATGKNQNFKETVVVARQF